MSHNRSFIKQNSSDKEEQPQLGEDQAQHTNEQVFDVFTLSDEHHLPYSQLTERDFIDGELKKYTKFTPRARSLMDVLRPTNTDIEAIFTAEYLRKHGAYMMENGYGMRGDHRGPSECLGTFSNEEPHYDPSKSLADSHNSGFLPLSINAGITRAYGASGASNNPDGSFYVYIFGFKVALKLVGNNVFDDECNEFERSAVKQTSTVACFRKFQKIDQPGFHMPEILSGQNLTRQQILDRPERKFTGTSICVLNKLDEGMKRQMLRAQLTQKERDLGVDFLHRGTNLVRVPQPRCAIQQPNATKVIRKFLKGFKGAFFTQACVGLVMVSGDCVVAPSQEPAGKKK